MIIIGYQGIGKSTVASKDFKYIDLESSFMRINNNRQDNWHEIYCNLAEKLSKRGYVVFVSSHKEVRERLKKSNEVVYICYPSLALREEWIDKLSKRYKLTNLEKDFRALKNAEDCYESNIKDLELSGFKSIEIKKMNYNLKRMIDSILKKPLSL